MSWLTDLLFGPDDYHVKKHEEMISQLSENEKICGICKGSGWVIAHCGDDRCGNCNGTGKVLINDKD